MLTFKELNTIAKTNISINSDCIPQDSFEIARSINLRIKNSMECKQDFPDKDPLRSNNAIYALFKGEYTIYYDEKYAYKNFAIAHEIAHHLLRHESDGTIQHHDSNLLAAILIAPKNLIKTHKIKSAKELSLHCSIPINVAEEYWKCIQATTPIKNTYVFSAIFLSIVIAIIGIYILKSHSNHNHNINTPVIEHNNIRVSDHIITTSGTKYHKPDCFHIKNKTNTIKLSIEEAEIAGYKPCKDCIRQ